MPRASRVGAREGACRRGEEPERREVWHSEASEMWSDGPVAFTSVIVSSVKHFAAVDEGDERRLTRSSGGRCDVSLSRRLNLDSLRWTTATLGSTQQDRLHALRPVESPPEPPLVPGHPHLRPPLLFPAVPWHSRLDRAQVAHQHQQLDLRVAPSSRQSPAASQSARLSLWARLPPPTLTATATATAKRAKSLTMVRRHPRRGGAAAAAVDPEAAERARQGGAAARASTATTASTAGALPRAGASTPTSTTATGAARLLAAVRVAGPGRGARARRGATAARGAGVAAGAGAHRRGGVEEGLRRGTAGAAEEEEGTWTRRP